MQLACIKNAARDLTALTGASWRDTRARLKELATIFCREGCVDGIAFGQISSVAAMNEFLAAFDSLRDGMALRVCGVEGSGRCELLTLNRADLIDCSVLKREIAVLDREDYHRLAILPAATYSAGPLLISRDRVRTMKRHLADILEPIFCGGPIPSLEAHILAALLREPFGADGLHRSLKRLDDGLIARAEGLLEASRLAVHRRFCRPVDRLESIGPDLLAVGCHVPGGAVGLLRDAFETNKEDSSLLLAVLLCEIVRAEPDEMIVAAFLADVSLQEGFLVCRPWYLVEDHLIAIGEEEGATGTVWPNLPFATAALNYSTQGIATIEGWSAAEGKRPSELVHQKLRLLADGVKEKVKAPLRERLSVPEACGTLRELLGRKWSDWVEIDSLNGEECRFLLEGIAAARTCAFLTPYEHGFIAEAPAVWLAGLLEGTDVVIDVDCSPSAAEYYQSLAPLREHLRVLREVSFRASRTWCVPGFDVGIHSVGHRGVPAELLKWALACSRHGEAIRKGDFKEAPQPETLTRWEAEEILHPLAAS